MSKTAELNASYASTMVSEAKQLEEEISSLKEERRQQGLIFDVIKEEKRLEDAKKGIIDAQNEAKREATSIIAVANAEAASIIENSKRIAEEVVGAAREVSKAAENSIERAKQLAGDANISFERAKSEWDTVNANKADLAAAKQDFNQMLEMFINTLIDLKKR